MTETVEAKPNFDQAASPLKGIKNIITPSGVVMRVAAVDLQWFNHFYTFEAQGKKCYQSIKTIAKEMGRAVSVAQERIHKLQALGLLEVGKEPFKDGWRNTYTCTPIDIILSRMTDAPVTPQDKPLKKSQLNSLLKKSGQVDPHAVNRGIKVMAKTIANRDLSDEEVMQFAFQIATEKLAALGWNIETIIEERNDEDEQQPVTDAPKTAVPVAGQTGSLPPVDAGDDVGLSTDDDAMNQITIFDEDGVVTEEFINSLSGDAAPNRNTDGTLQSIRYVYWVARHSQDEHDGIPVRTREEYMAEAKPEYFPFHLLPDDVPAPITEPAPAMQQVNGPDVDHINCEDSEETQEEEFEAPF
ncbi:TPA: hypothetical protein ACNVZR_003175 [Citrobacter freundii]